MIRQDAAGSFTNATAENLAIKKALMQATTSLVVETNAAAKIKNMTLTVNEHTADRMVQTEELRTHFHQDGPGSRSTTSRVRIRLPGHLYGINVKIVYHNMPDNQALLEMDGDPRAVLITNLFEEEAEAAA